MNIELDLERTTEIFTFLDMLKETGKVNMLGATPYLMGHYDLDRREARAWLKQWIDRPKKEAALNQLLKGEPDEYKN